MDKELFQKKFSKYLIETEDNYIGKNVISEDLVGVRIFDEPLFGYANKDDELFNKMKQHEVIGPHFLKPDEWIENAKSVISIFLPFSEKIRVSNRGGQYPSSLWLHGRIDGQNLIVLSSNKIVEYLNSEGYSAVSPSHDPRFRFELFTVEDPEDEWFGKSHTCNWSEIHVAYTCGLGTFGLSKSLITEKGSAGRILSVVTNAEIQPSERKYEGLYDYCSECGMCIVNCPVEAISYKNGKEHKICAPYMLKMNEMFNPRIGCGKCQVGLQCEYEIPVSK